MYRQITVKIEDERGEFDMQVLQVSTNEDGCLRIRQVALAADQKDVIVTLTPQQSFALRWALAE